MKALLLAALLAAPAPAQLLRGAPVSLRPLLPVGSAVTPALGLTPLLPAASAAPALPSAAVSFPKVLAAPALSAVNAAAPAPEAGRPAAAAVERLTAAAGREGAPGVPAAVFDGSAAPSPEEELSALRAENAGLRARLAEHERLVARAVHDLRNPLTPLDGYAAMLESGALNERQRGHAAKVRAAAKRLNEMLGDLLDMSRAQAAPLRREPVDLGLLVRAAAGGLEAAAAQRGVRVELALAEGAAVSGDEGLLRRVVENLASNGVKYNRAGGRLRVTAARVPGGVELAFSDEGIGVAAEDVPHLFTPFFRTDAARAAAPGNGLGLSSVKAAVERHGGRVAVESVPGRGTTFRVFLPA